MAKSRDFEEISPVEMRNAAHQIQHHTTEELTQDELERALLRAFGFRRRTQRVQKHLTATFKDSL